MINSEVIRSFAVREYELNLSNYIHHQNPAHLVFAKFCESRRNILSLLPSPAPEKKSQRSGNHQTVDHEIVLCLTVRASGSVRASCVRLSVCSRTERTLIFHFMDHIVNIDTEDAF